MIILPLLTDSNYHVWARSMKRVLILKNKYRFVGGRSGFYHLETSTTRRGNASTISFNHGLFLRFLHKSLKTWYFLITLLMFGMNRGNNYRIVLPLYIKVILLLSINKSFWEEIEHYRPLCQCVCRICKAKDFHLKDYMIHFLLD